MLSWLLTQREYLVFHKMAFPSIRSSSSDNLSSDSTTHTITLPPTVNSGDLLLVLYTQDGANTDPWDNTSEGTWTEKWNVASQGMWSTGQVKVADGTEDSQTLTITSGVSERHAYIVYAIQDWEGTLSGIEVGTLVEAAGVTLDPPSLTPSWGSDDTFWIAFYGNDRRGNTQNPVTPPSGFVLSIEEVGGNPATTRVNCATAIDDNTSSPLDPGTFSDLAASDGSHTQTIAVQPAGAAVVTRPLLLSINQAVNRAANF